MFMTKIMAPAQMTRYFFLLSLLQGGYSAQSMACEASYDPRTGAVTIPCVKENNSAKLYNVDMEHRGGLTFEVVSVDAVELIDAVVSEVQAQVVEIPVGNPFYDFDRDKTTRTGAIIVVSGSHHCALDDIYDSVEISGRESEQNSSFTAIIDLSIKEKERYGRNFCNQMGRSYEKTILIDSLMPGTYDVVVNGESHTTLTVQ